MSEAYRRSERYRGGPRAQGSEPGRPPVDQGIDPGQAAEFRRRLDYQGSAELIPTAGPDAAADQGPAIKALWEPRETATAEPGPRRRDRRPPARATRPGGGKRRKRSLVISGATAAVVTVGVIGVVGLNGRGPLAKGAATRVLPAVSSSGASGSQGATSTIGSSLSITGSHSPSASPSRSASPSASAAKASPSASSSPSASRSASPSPSAKPSPRQTTCFLIFCG